MQTLPIKSPQPPYPIKNERSLTLYEHTGKRTEKRWEDKLTLYERCKVRRNVKNTRLIQHSTHVRKNVYKRTLVSYKRI